MGILGERLAKALWDHVFPLFWTFLFGKQKDFLFSGGLFVGCHTLGGPGILGLALAMLSLASYPLSLSMLVAGLLLVIWLGIPVLSFLRLLSTG